MGMDTGDLEEMCGYHEVWSQRAWAVDLSLTSFAPQNASWTFYLPTGFY